MKIIDAHMHLNKDIESFYELAKVSEHEYSEKGIKDMFDKYGVVGGVVMGNRHLELENHIYPNYLNYLVGVDGVCFDKNKKEYFLELVEKHLKRDNCKGIKIYAGYVPLYVYDEWYFPFYELAKKYNKPVAIHTGSTSKSDAYLKYSHPLTLDDVCTLFPDVNFVMCHFGNPWLNDAAAVITKNMNLYADISGILVGKPNMNSFFDEYEGYISMLKTWISYTGAYDRIMFGTDFPLVNMGCCIEFAKKIIPKKYYNKVFYENAVKIYNLNF